MLKIIELRNLDRKDVPLAYRRSFTAEAMLEGIHSGEFTQSIEFDIEKDALGNTDITVKVFGTPQYPMVPLLRALKAHISELESSGALS